MMLIAPISGGWWRSAPIALLVLPLLTTDPALAQHALERHLPPAPQSRPTRITIGRPNFGKASSKPLGVNLAGIHLIGEKAAVAKHPPTGLSGTPKGVVAKKFDASLHPFLGRPLSLKLARHVQAAVARVYRKAGHPFVSITLPPQDVTSGVLQVRVIEFRLGRVAVAGSTPEEAKAIRRDLRVKPEQRIDARALDEDLTWLNRSPYRRAEGVFRPGEQTALTNLRLSITRKKPWQVLGGWTNTGSADTGRDRYFIGMNALLQPLNGTWLSYQLTGSADLWDNPGRIIPSTGDFPDYLSHAGRLVIPTWPR